MTLEVLLKNVFNSVRESSILPDDCIRIIVGYYSDFEEFDMIEREKELLIMWCNKILLQLFTPLNTLPMVFPNGFSRDEVFMNFCPTEKENNAAKRCWLEYGDANFRLISWRVVQTSILKIERKTKQYWSKNENRYHYISHDYKYRDRFKKILRKEKSYLFSLKSVALKYVETYHQLKQLNIPDGSVEQS